MRTLEAQAFERRLLRVADARFDLPFAVRIADATWQRDDAVMREHVAIERIQRRIVDVRREHAFAEVVGDNHMPPNRRNARSCSSAQMRALDRHVSSRTHLRE
jgi:hypothetical protein